MKNIEVFPHAKLRAEIKEKSVDIPKCSFKVYTDKDDRGKNKPLKDKCHCNASLTLKGKPYCIRHAQIIALQLLLQGELIFKY